jgi:molybdopterin converting factor small subunit
MTTVRIPTQLRNLSGGESEVEIEVSTVEDVLKGLEGQFRGFGERLFDDAGQLRRFVNVFVADEDIRFLNGTDTVIEAGQVVSIIPAVAGGS